MVIVSDKIKAEDLLQCIDHETAWRDFCPGFKSFKKLIDSPFRVETAPSFSVKLRDGVAFYKDFGSGDSGTIITFVMKYYNTTFKEALYNIGFKYNLCTKSGTVKALIVRPTNVVEDPPTIIDVEYRDYTKRDLKYWSEYWINRETLEKFQVYSVDKLYINGKHIKFPSSSLCFCYEFPIGRKIYFPERKRFKWFSNIPTSYIENLEGIKNKGILTKARKDRMVLSAIIENVANSQNESTSWCTEENLNVLSRNVNELYINYDNDPPGVIACKKITQQYGYKYFNVPKYLLKYGIKDFADWVRVENSYEPAIRYLKKKKLI